MEKREKTLSEILFITCNVVSALFISTVDALFISTVDGDVEHCVRSSSRIRQHYFPWVKEATDGVVFWSPEVEYFSREKGRGMIFLEDVHFSWLKGSRNLFFQKLSISR
jgi:hypothetical protein